ncbi:uncharacterized protein LOC110837184 isoform X2 [Zootermopsis nevadensis]|uniref:Uncharacterized protein n=1 Tax=Zootermopsis nevadensis TaxID=136037 RepID=A0A067QPF6_ZOONE|nr:uncharacterized protein LOC110837184 isoform X2 [Zootermopsis nevadensis]KDR11334.1 hypothetical protein L798_14876 [Zootermopsis nevadensis]
MAGRSFTPPSDDDNNNNGDQIVPSDEDLSDEESSSHKTAVKEDKFVPGRESGVRKRDIRGVLVEPKGAEESTDSLTLLSLLTRRNPYPFEECEEETIVAEEEEEEGEWEEVDLFSEIACPFLKIEHDRCFWGGRILRLKNHMVLTHFNVLRLYSTFTCAATDTTASLLVVDSEVFLYYKFITEYGHWYVVVQQVGTTNKKFRYRIKLHSEDETIPDRIYIFRVTRITVDFEVLFDAEKCFVSSDAEMEPFVTDLGADMRVTIKRNRSHN